MRACGRAGAPCQMASLALQSPRACNLHKAGKKARGRPARQARMENSTMRPLEGLRVVDLTRVLSGPYCAMQLGDLGAEVIKVERPGEGDDTRSFAPPFQGDQAAYFLSVNRNKKSM